jgi:hypothetical protein
MMQKTTFVSALVLALVSLCPDARTQMSGTLLPVNQNDVTLSVIDPGTGKQTVIIQEEGRIKAHEVTS